MKLVPIYKDDFFDKSRCVMVLDFTKKDPPITKVMRLYNEENAPKHLKSKFASST